MLLFYISYVISAVVGSSLSATDGTFVSFWLPAGLYLAALLLAEYREWPWLAVTALAANFSFDLWHGTKPEVICFFFAANTIQTVVGAWLVRKFVAERPRLATLKEFAGLLFFAAVFSAMLGAIIGGATLVHFGMSKSFGQSWKIWWGSNAMAILLLTPFILTWLPKQGQSKKIFGSSRRIVEAVLLFVGLSGYIWYLLAFDKGVMSPNKTLGIPLMLWAGLRFGARGATATNLFLALPLAFFTTQYSTGLTAAQAQSGEYVFVLQTVLAMAVLVSLIPAIVVAERDRSLTELRESEERFKNLSAAAFEGIAISENGVLLDVNNQFLMMFGYSNRDEIIGRPIIDFVAPEWRDSIARRIQEGRETIYGHALLRKDGSIFFAEAQAKIIRAGGRLLRMTALRDITERKKTEQALRESEEKFSKAFRTSPDVMSITDFETGRYLEVNEAHEKAFGYKREEVIGRSPIELGIYSNQEIREYMLQLLREHGRFSDIEIQTATRDGKNRTVLHSGELIELGGRRCVLRVSHDITDRKDAEEALRKSEEQFRGYFEQAIVGCAITSVSKGVLTVNDQFCKMLGYSRKELHRMKWDEFTHPDDLAADETQFNRMIQGKIDSYTLDKRFIRKDGRIVYTTIAVRCLRHPDGSPDYVMGLAMDITQRQESILREQQARAEYTFQLIASQEAERTRIARELHDSLGQNLLLIKNRAQLELSKKKLPTKLREQLQGISDLATLVIAEVRQISHDLHPHHLDHLGLTRSLKVMVENAGEASKIEVKGKFDVVDDVFSREAATNIYRTVQESLNNIIKHSGADRARITLERDIHEVTLKIEDDGCGFDASAKSKGLGLKNLAERTRMLGGKLKISSRTGKG
ncbi:MAG TPA: PAS domain S-box protein, partial [Verrucomicrobiae bacterium]|nr:PAS domain S-box protein [Verrucomicrobiae bacterium]